jgi:hypothetical protein
MTLDDIALIENELKIVLPPGYIAAVTPFPIPALVGNTDTNMWDNAEALIKFNRELREKSNYRTAWPSHLYAMGRDHGGCQDAIDLSDPSFPVYWVDREQWEDALKSKPVEKFDRWILNQLKETLSDFYHNGEDPDAIPEQLQKNRDKINKSDFVSCLWGLLIIGALISLLIYFAKR